MTQRRASGGNVICAISRISRTGEGGQDTGALKRTPQA
jgi:hypothetical protein